MQRVQTRRDFLVPFTITFTFCRLGKNLRRVCPVIFLPAPPLALAIPRRLMVRPDIGFLPQIAQTNDIKNSFNEHAILDTFVSRIMPSFEEVYWKINFCQEFFKALIYANIIQGNNGNMPRPFWRIYPIF